METGTQAKNDLAFAYALNLLANQSLTGEELKNVLLERGLDAENASITIARIYKHLQDVKKVKAKNDMLYGALWCVGGTVATLAHIGFIFWGAIIFGGVQFFGGLSNA